MLRAVMLIPRRAVLLLAGGLVACSRGRARDEVTPRPTPEPPEGAAPSSPPEHATPRPPLGASAWGSLRWGMTEDEVIAAVAKDGMVVERRDGGLEIDTRTLSIKGEGMHGTLYVEGTRGLRQVLLFGEETGSDATARAALARLTRAHGAPDAPRRRDARTWWNARMALELTIVSPDREGGFHVGEHYVADARPERAGVSPDFDAVNGWGPFKWDARPEEVEAWLGNAKIAFGRFAGDGDPGPNAPISDDVGLPSLTFQHAGTHVIASITSKRGLMQVLTGASYKSAAEAMKVVVERVKRYGPATTVERRTTHRWERGPTKVELEVVQKETGGRFWYAEGYTPAG